MSKSTDRGGKVTRPIPIPKHGSHSIPPKNATISGKKGSDDLEDPNLPMQAEESEFLPWEVEGERELRDESEDPDEPSSL